MSEPADNLSQLVATLQQLQLENVVLRDSLRDLQASASNPHPTESNLPPTESNLPPSQASASSHSYTLEPKISLPDKFDGTRSRFRGFVNQIRLIIRLQPQRYHDDFRQVGLVGTLLSGPAQAWFAPLVETSSPLLEDFPAFLAEFESTFGETDRRRSALTKLYSLQQGSRAASLYASEFRQLACDVKWDDQALCDHFRRGLRGDIKNLLLNFPEPTSLSQAISQAVQCDNRLFEFRHDERVSHGFPSFSRNTPVVRPRLPVPPILSHPPTLGDNPVPMEIDRARFRPLTDAQRQYRRDHGLCLYCGASDHLIRQCPRSHRQQTYRAHAVQGSQQPQQQENDIVQLQ